MTHLNAAERNALAFNSARQIAREAGVDGSDDSYLFTLDFAAGVFVITQHTFNDGSVEFARCNTLAALKAARLRMATPNEEGEGCGHTVAITVAADRAMRAAR